MFTFHSRKRVGNELSNFHNSEVIVDSRTYNSGEAAFHGMKYISISQELVNNGMGGKRSNVLFAYGLKFEVGNEFGNLTGYDLKRMGGKKGLALSGSEQLIWVNKRVAIQIAICQYKLDNYEHIRDVLKSTGDNTLIHPAMRCSDTRVVSRFWEGRGKQEGGKIIVLGTNMLGKIWMVLRNTL